MDKRVSTEILSRAAKWETRSQKYTAQGKFDKAGECRTKALKLISKYHEKLKEMGEL